MAYLATAVILVLIFSVSYELRKTIDKLEVEHIFNEY